MRTKGRTKLIAGVLVTVMVAAMTITNFFTNTMADTDSYIKIISFERENPAYTDWVDAGTGRDELRLPTSLRAVCELSADPEAEVKGFRQTAPAANGDGNYDYYWYGYVAPRDEAELRKTGKLVIYTIYYEDGHEEYRVHGTYNGENECFYACNESGKVIGIVLNVPVEWNGAYIPNTLKTYKLTAKIADGLAYSGTAPTAEVTVQDMANLPIDEHATCDRPDYVLDPEVLKNAEKALSFDDCACPEGTLGHSDKNCPFYVPLADCDCGIDANSLPWEHNIECEYNSKPVCTCEGGKHDPGNNKCLIWNKPGQIVPLSINGDPSPTSNDTIGDNVMLNQAPTSGNPPYMSSYTTGTNIPGSWVNYVNTIWLNKGFNKFAWTQAANTGAHNGWAWGGGTATQNAGGGITTLNTANCIPAAAGGIWTVYSGEQLLYALTQFSSTQTISLGGNINLNGMTRNWTTVKFAVNGGTPKTLTFEGNNFTIYNLGVTMAADIGTGYTDAGLASFITNFGNLTMRNINFVTAKIVNHLSQGHDDGSGAGYPREKVSGSGILGLPYNVANANAVRNVTNVTIEKSLLFAAGRSSFLCFDQVSSGPGTNGSDNYLTNVIMKNNFSYGTDHISGFVTRGGDYMMSNYCASFDNLVCGIGGHSAAYNPCSTYTADHNNSFASNEMYCSKYVSGFVGAVRGSTTNCFSSGKLEGYTEMAGFSFNDGRGDFNITNCYSTTLVGLRTMAEGATAATQHQSGFVTAIE
ncbi:MAG: hypothetical protein FWF08_09730, partial [Oscillospiraceae bacterium]|nr:hypothetical protein [Oscillospiraceae bacterium]